MINISSAKKFCCEDISLIENYQEAISDQTQTWVCHHRLECVNGIYTSPAELKKKGLYRERPAVELIFLTRAEHNKIHNTDPIRRQRLSKTMKGKNLGKKLSAEHKEHLSAALKGKKLSVEHKEHIGEARLGCHWWNNGIICKLSRECPGQNFVRGRKK